ALPGTGSFAASPVRTVQSAAPQATPGVAGGATSDASRFSLANGQPIRGNATVSGPLGVASGATVAPGTAASPGRLTKSTDVVFSAGSTYTVRLNGTAAGIQYDQLRVNGDVTLGNSTLSTSLGFAPTPSNVLFIIDNSGLNPVNGTFLGQPDNSIIVMGTYFAQISYF